MEKKIFIITGELSGDALGGELVKNICKKNKNVRFYGIGGHNMKRNMVSLFVNIKDLSIMGFLNAISKLFLIIKVIKITKKKIKKKKPDLVILIDFPDFNLYIASVAKKFKIPVLYYVPPQVWAWRKNRIYKIKKLVDHVVVTFPFEEKIYKKERIPVSFVEHPILREAKLSYSKNYCKDGKDTIGILPGSRDCEIKYILPNMLKATKIIKELLPEKKFIISVSRSIDQRKFYEIFKPYENLGYLSLKEGPVQHIFKTSSFLIATSGTVTLESALHGIPTLILYKTSLVNYLIGKVFVKSKYIGLPNIILDRMVFTELIQIKANPDNIAKEVVSILNNKKKINKIKNDLVLIKKKLKSYNCSSYISDLVMSLI